MRMGGLFSGKGKKDRKANSSRQESAVQSQMPPLFVVDPVSKDDVPAPGRTPGAGTTGPGQAGDLRTTGTTGPGQAGDLRTTGSIREAHEAREGREAREDRGGRKSDETRDGRRANARKVPPLRDRRMQRVSMAKKISANYVRMFTNWSYGIITLLFVLSMSLNGLFYYDNLARTRQAIEQSPVLQTILSGEERAEGSLSVATSPLVPLEDAYVVVDDQGRVLLHKTEEHLKLDIPLVTGDLTTGPFPFRFQLRDNRLWLGVSTQAFPAGQATPVFFRYAADITLRVMETVGLFCIGFVLATFGIGVISLKGRLSTRKTLRRIDELTAKISAISSQNLNLRLTVSDATDELVDLAVTFNQMMERLERAYGKQNQFVSDASHELRTPISVIQGYARMLERWGKSDPAILDEAISAISKECRNMQDLVEKLLFIARNDRDSLVLVMAPFNLSDMMKELGRETAMLETGHRLICQVQDGIHITGDRNRLKQALRVFVDNALKYTEKGGAITLRLLLRDGVAEATVLDTGIGIPEQDLPNVFDRFYRVDSARERNTGGHGLGLSIARIIVLRHNGRITVGSKVGAGTRFTVKLPLRVKDLARSTVGPLPNRQEDCT